MNFDAYTIRKMAPRLIVAVIAVNVSIYLCLAAVDFTNVLGGGMAQLLVGPFSNTEVLDYKIGDAQSTGAGLLGAGLFTAIGTAIWATIGTGGAAAVFILGGIGILLLLLMILVLLIGLAVIMTLIIRQGLLMFLIISSPVAIALFVLPGTEKYFRQWLKLFSAMLMLYPMIAVIFAMSDILVALLLGAK